MNSKLSSKSVSLLFLVTLAGFMLFAALTGMEAFGLTSARHPDRWALWRYLIVLAWLSLAYMLYVSRGKNAWKQSLLSSLVTAGVISLILANIWIGVSSGYYAILGSAVAYTLIAALCSMIIERHLIAAIVSGTLIFVQIATDIVILGFAGQFRIH